MLNKKDIQKDNEMPIEQLWARLLEVERYIHESIKEKGLYTFYFVGEYLELYETIKKKKIQEKTNLSHKLLNLAKETVINGQHELASSYLCQEKILRKYF